MKVLFSRSYRKKKTRAKNSKGRKEKKKEKAACEPTYAREKGSAIAWGSSESHKKKGSPAVRGE